MKAGKEGEGYIIDPNVYSLDPVPLQTKDQNLIDMGVRYLSIVGFSYPFIAFSISFGTALRSIRNPKLPLVISVGSLSLNAILNYLLIFGQFGFPRMGVEGAALATVMLLRE